MNTLHKILSLILVLACTVACVDTGDDVDTRYAVAFSSTLPDGVTADDQIVTGSIKLKELNTGITTTVELPLSAPIQLTVGTYDVDAQQVVLVDGVEKTMRASQSSLVINDNTTISLEWFFYNADNTLIFSEIYFTGSPNATQTGGVRDTYVKIYNNTDRVLYADGLGLCESCFVNSSTNAFEILTEANNRQVNFTAGTIWVIPGNGTDVPVQPGESITLVDQAIDWSATVSGALDQRGATFEWWDDNKQDTDNPEVPNLDKWYCYSLTIWVPSNQCNRSYALVRFPEGMTAEQYLAQYYGKYEYISIIGTTMYNEKAYLIPNEWIIDGVNLSNDEKWVYGALANSIDNSYASISEANSDPSRFGRKLVRRVAQVADNGRVIYQDTNDSSADFIRKSVNE